MSSLKFGTSGLRGLVVDLLGQPSRRWTAAFLETLPDRADKRVLIGRDLRDSSPSIAADCAAGACTAGWQPVDAGALPTPALALAAMSRDMPAIMVTGSHIPDDRNGLKFYLPTGEITKTDEACIRAAYDGRGPVDTTPGCTFRPETALTAYIDRYRRFFAPDSLAGLNIGVYQQSAVGRDALFELIQALGATAVSLARSDRFIPIDTEAHHPRDIALMAEWAKSGAFDAIVSTDGDSDRPLVADSKGNFVRGDLLGLLTAAYLEIDRIVTPVTSGAAVERSGIAQSILRTRVGSPYVIEGMNRLRDGNRSAVLGFEANGGVLLGGDIVRNGRALSALPTRDAFLPILASLAYARRHGVSLRDAVNGLSPGYAVADRLENVASERSAAFLSKLAEDRAFAAATLASQGVILSQDTIDGIRFVLEDGSVVHYRASGNAPELRCYIEANDQTRASELLAWGLSVARTATS